MNTNESLDKFGHFIIRNMRDNAIDFFDKLLEGRFKAEKLQNLLKELKQFTPEQITIIRKCLIAGIDTTIHDFLFALEEIAETSQDIEVLVDGKNVVNLSDELHRELFSENGWFSKFSQYQIEF